MNQETVLSKVRKLVALAGNNPNEEEARSAMMKAQALLNEHGLAMADAEDQGRPRKPEEVEVGDGDHKTAVWWKQQIAVVVAKNFRCGVYISRRGRWGGSGIRLVGLEEDVRVAQQVFELACRTCWKASVRFRRQAKKDAEAQSIGWSRGRAKRVANDFLTGFIDGLREAFRKNVAEMQTALVVVKPKAVQDHMDAMNLTRARRSSIATDGRTGARSAGRAEGQRFNARPKLRG